MTWKTLKARLSDPIVAGGLLLMVIGEIQRQSDVLLSWLGPEGAGVVIKSIQALPEPKDADPTDSAGA